MKGIFLTMEGPDGSGKTTQILKLKEHLMQHGYDEVVVTREPGGTVISEAVRGILVTVLWIPLPSIRGWHADLASRRFMS